MEPNQLAGNQQKIKRGREHEGPRNHIIGFVASLVLTFIAFVAVANESLSPTFVIFLIVLMAIVQVIVQLAYWMHMKDKGHMFPIIFLAMGAVVAFTCFVMALLWVWW